MNSRAADREIAALVGMAVDPQIDVLQEPLAVAGVGGRYDLGFRTRPYRLLYAPVVRNHDCAADGGPARGACDELARFEMTC
jgi:hypothetical protein